jgi:type VI secretion system protein ImpE
VSQADDLLRDGDIDGARAALVDIVRAKPGDVPARLFLFQLLCVVGEWEKARTQLKTLAQLSPEAQMLSVAYGQAIDAEIERAAVFAGRSQPALLVRDSPWAGPLAAAIGHEAAGRTAEAEAARGEAFDAAPDTPGRFNDEPFEWIADVDPRFGPAFEAIIAGRWGLVPFDAVEKIDSEGPKDLRDIVWYPVQIGFRTGQSVAAMLPARYPGSEGADDAALRLTRSTSWTGADETGVGQHMLMLSGGSEHGLLSLRSLVFG